VQWDEEGDGATGRVELLAPTSPALRETDPVVIGVGGCNDVDPNEGHVRPEHRALIGERHTYPPHHGDKERAPDSSPDHRSPCCCHRTMREEHYEGKSS
jgi:hypothetical protein